MIQDADIFIKYMNDIYIRTELKEGKAQDVVLCMVINYYDLDTFIDKIDEYKELIEIMLLHYKNTYDVNSKNLNIFMIHLILFLNLKPI